MSKEQGPVCFTSLELRLTLVLGNPEETEQFSSL